jgi:colicin V production protein
MSWFDLAGLLVLALAIFDGARSGLAWALLELALLCGVAVVTRGLAAGVEPYMGKVADLPPADLRSASHVLVFGVTSAILLGVLVLLHPASRRWRFRRDSWLGALVGGVNGLFAALLVFSIVLWAAPQPSYEDLLVESRLRPVLAGALESGLGPLFPEYTAERLTELRDQ